VMPGEVIAITGNTGRSTGPHLHLTCKFQNRYINPGILLQFVRETKEEAVARLGIF
ncbi:M23 family metallopeptidase, partial [Phocaeicola dorei]